MSLTYARKIIVRVTNETLMLLLRDYISEMYVRLSKLTRGSLVYRVPPVEKPRVTSLWSWNFSASGLCKNTEIELL